MGQRPRLAPAPGAGRERALAAGDQVQLVAITFDRLLR